MKRLALLLAIVAIAIGMNVLTRGSSPDELSAPFATACAQRVLSDWYDNGRIDRRYHRGRYERALDLLPEGWEDLSGLKQGSEGPSNGAADGMR
jgi:hypothetical protein